MVGTRVEATLLKVVDGDTIKVTLDGRNESVRLTCLDTSSSSAPRSMNTEDSWTSTSATA